MDDAGENAHGIAASLKKPSLQSYIWKFTNGRAKEPRRASLQPLADRYRVPVEAFYDAHLATQVALERGLAGSGSVGHKPTSQTQPKSADQPIDAMQAIEVLAHALSTLDKATRSAVAPLLSLLAQEPDQFENIATTLGKLLPATNLARIPKDDESAGREISAVLPSLERKELQGHAKRISNQGRGRT